MGNCTNAEQSPRKKASHLSTDDSSIAINSRVTVDDNSLLELQKEKKT